jgi:hypothetical protein
VSDAEEVRLLCHGRASSRPSTSLLPERNKDVDARHKAGHDQLYVLRAPASVRIAIIIASNSSTEANRNGAPGNFIGALTPMK